MKSSLKLLFLCTLTSFTLGVISNLIWWMAAKQITNPPGALNVSHNIALAEYHLSTGDVEKSITEYKIVADDHSHPDRAMAASRIIQISIQQQSSAGRLTQDMVWFLWRAYPRLYVVGGFFLLTWIILLFRKWSQRDRSFVIKPIVNATDLHGIDKLPMLIIERMREIQWKTKEAASTINKIITEQLELPSVGLIDEKTDVNIDKIIETAWAISSGGGNLSLGNLMESLRLWLIAPTYVISGYLFQSENAVQLHLFMYNGYSGELKKNWQLTLKKNPQKPIVSTLVDDAAFLLLHYFNRELSTRYWRALQASTNGVLFFDAYITDNQNQWLASAQNSLERALDIDPNYDIAKYNLGLVFMAMGEFDAARKIFKPLSLQ